MFALIGYGGEQAGIRPRTRLACILNTKIQTWNGHGWVNCSLKVEEVTIYKTWTRHPEETEVRRAKKRLSPIP